MRTSVETRIEFHNDAEATALAQLVKRLTWSALRECAIDDDEAYVMRDAVSRLARGLAEAGFAPR